MKLILLATLAIAAIVSPVQAAAKPFKVENVVITTMDGKIPKGTPVYNRGATVKLNIQAKRLTAPKKVTIPVLRTTDTEIVYSKIDGKQGKSDVATVTKQDGKITRVVLVFTRKVASPFPGVTMPGLVTYTLVPK